MKLNKLLNNNTFLVNSCICLVVLLAICYLGISSPVKKTYSASLCSTFGGREVITEDGTTVCLDNNGLLNSNQKIYGEYKWNDSYDKIANPGWFTLEINSILFEANGQEYYGIGVNSSSGERNIGYLKSGGKDVVSVVSYKDDNTVVYSDGWSASTMTVNFTSIQSIVDSSEYNWFVNSTTPVKKCYYNKNSDSFVYSNIPSIGTPVAIGFTLNPVEKCENTVRLSFVDTTGGVKFGGVAIENEVRHMDKGTEFILSSMTSGFEFTRTGYTFEGWSTVETGEGALYQNTSTIKLDGNVTLYARWKPITYKVTFNANGGAGTMEDQEFTYDVEQKLSANKFTFNGKKLLGWVRGDSIYTSELYTDRKQVKNLSSTAGATVELIAMWSDLSQYTITYISNTEDTVTNMPNVASKYVGDSLTISSKIPTRVGYAFMGWYDNSECNGSPYKADDVYSTDADLVLYAKWIKPVTFDSTYTVNDANKYIIVPVPVAEETFKNNVTLDSGYMLSVETKKVGTEDYLFTGSKATIKASDGSTFSEYTVIVLGDINGDGDITTVDTNTIYNCFTGAANLSGIFAKAADMNQSGEITTADYNTAYNYFL